MITIAVCDDNRPALEKLAAILREICGRYWEEFGIRTFESGESLLEAHEKAPFDILFLDIRMPGMDGFSAASCFWISGCQEWTAFPRRSGSEGREGSGYR